MSYSTLEVGSEIRCRSDSNDVQFFDCVQVLSNEAVSKRNRIIAVTKSQIAEIAPQTFSFNNTGLVIEVHELRGLEKLKFKRGSASVLSIHFKNQRILRFAMTNPDPCVECIKGRMKLIGMQGNVRRNSVTAKEIKTAEAFLEATREIEAQFSLRPSFQLVLQIMDLLREAVERFAGADDQRYSEIISSIQKFLTREDVIEILDKNAKEKKEEDKEATSVPLQPPEISAAAEVARAAATIDTPVIQAPASPLPPPPKQPITPNLPDSPSYSEGEVDAWVAESRSSYGESDIYSFFPEQADPADSLSSAFGTSASMYDTLQGNSRRGSRIMRAAEADGSFEQPSSNHHEHQDGAESGIFENKNPMIADDSGDGARIGDHEHATTEGRIAGENPMVRNTSGAKLAEGHVEGENPMLKDVSGTSDGKAIAEGHVEGENPMLKDVSGTSDGKALAEGHVEGENPMLTDAIGANVVVGQDKNIVDIELHEIFKGPVVIDTENPLVALHSEGEVGASGTS